MTKSDAARMDKIKRMPCMACVQEGCSQPGPTEVHHLVDRGYRKHSGGHQATIPLCNWHHRADVPWGHTASWMRAYYGPSMAHESKLFARVYGKQRELLARVDAVLK
jgi:Recombination enhancement, RecA-dependent nuclease